MSNATHLDRLHTSYIVISILVTILVVSYIIFSSQMSVFPFDKQIKSSSKFNFDKKIVIPEEQKFNPYFVIDNSSGDEMTDKASFVQVIVTMSKGDFWEDFDSFEKSSFWFQYIKGKGNQKLYIPIPKEIARISSNIVFDIDYTFISETIDNFTEGLVAKTSISGITGTGGSGSLTNDDGVLDSVNNIFIIDFTSILN